MINAFGIYGNGEFYPGLTHWSLLDRLNKLVDMKKYLKLNLKVVKFELRQLLYQIIVIPF